MNLFALPLVVDSLSVLFSAIGFIQAARSKYFHPLGVINFSSFLTIHPVCFVFASEFLLSAVHLIQNIFRSHLTVPFCDATVAIRQFFIFAAFGWTTVLMFSYISFHRTRVNPMRSHLAVWCMAFLFCLPTIGFQRTTIYQGMCLMSRISGNLFFSSLVVLYVLSTLLWFRHFHSLLSFHFCYSINNSLERRLRRMGARYLLTFLLVWVWPIVFFFLVSILHLHIPEWQDPITNVFWGAQGVVTFVMFQFDLEISRGMGMMSTGNSSLLPRHLVGPVSSITNSISGLFSRGKNKGEARASQGDREDKNYGNGDNGNGNRQSQSIDINRSKKSEGLTVVFYSPTFGTFSNDSNTQGDTPIETVAYRDCAKS